MKRAMTLFLLIGLLASAGTAAAETDSDAESTVALSVRAAALYYWNAPAEAFTPEAAAEAFTSVEPDALFQKDAPLHPLPAETPALKAGAKKASGEPFPVEEVLPALTVGAEYPLVFTNTGARITVRYVGESGYAMTTPASDWDARVILLAFSNVKSFDRKAAVLSVGSAEISAYALPEYQGALEKNALPEGLRLYFADGTETVAGLVSLE